MNIIKSSIRNLVIDEASPFYELEGKLQHECDISLKIRSFHFEPNPITPPIFDLGNLRETFYEVQPRTALPKPFSFIDGSIQEIFPSLSKDFIDLHLFCSGKASQPISKSDIPIEWHDEAQKNVDCFWVEVGKHFQLAPTRTYRHYPSSESYFDFGVFWEFCFILLNDKTGQGIVLSGNATD